MSCWPRSWPRPDLHRFRERTIFSCEVGERSAVAAEMAVAQGVHDVVNFRGGMKAWREAGLPVEKPAPKDGATGRPGDFAGGDCVRGGRIWS